MYQLLFLLAFCFLPSYQTQQATSLSTSSIPISGGSNIQVYGSGFDCVNDLYACDFQGAYNPAICVNSKLLICQSSAVSYTQNTNINLQILNGELTTIGTFTITYVIPDTCFQPMSQCRVVGDPHFFPFCSGGVTYNIQQVGIFTLAVSMDNTFQVLGQTTPIYLNGGSVCNLNAISVIGPAADGTLSEKIIYDSSVIGTLKVTYGGLDITSIVLKNSYSPNQYSGITISSTSVSFANGESVSWDGPSGTTVISLPGAQYWKNIKGLCGYLDASMPFCNSNPKPPQLKPVYYNPSNPVQLSFCASSWKLAQPNLKRSIEDFYSNSTTIIANVTYDDPDNTTVPAFVVPNNFITNVATSICNSMFDSLRTICPKNHSQNLPSYHESCVYDGAALLSYQLNQIVPGFSFDSITDLLKSVQNLGKLGETALSGDAFTVMEGSVRSGISDCLFQNLTFNATKPVFNSDVFTSALPGCESYCKLPGMSCSSNRCQFTLTLGELITYAGSSSSVQINVVFMFFIVCALSIW